MKRPSMFLMAGLAAAGLISATALTHVAGRSEPPQQQRLRITGSSTIAPLMAELAKHYEDREAGARIDVQAGGSSRGLADVHKGLAEIGMVSRALRPDERGAVTGHLLARDGLALIVHRANPLRGLTAQQVRALYTGKTKRWPALGGPDRPVILVHKADGRATLEVFLDYFKLDNTEITPDAVVGHNEQAIKTVAANEGAIGYVSIGAAMAAIGEGAAIRMLALDGVQPAAETVADGRYPLARELTLVTGGPPQGLTAAFLAFAQSPQADSIIRRAGFVPPPR